MTVSKASDSVERTVWLLAVFLTAAAPDENANLGGGGGILGAPDGRAATLDGIPWAPRNGLVDRGLCLGWGAPCGKAVSELSFKEGMRWWRLDRPFGLVDRLRSKVPLALRATREQTKHTCCRDRLLFAT